MADLDIAAMNAAQKLAFAQATGSILLAAGAVANITDISLALGYEKFRLELQGVVMDAADQISYRFSSDGGVTLHDGSSDYRVAIFSCGYTAGTITPASLGFTDSQGALIYDAFQGGDPLLASSGMCSATIWPGSSTTYPTVRSDSCDVNTVDTRFPSLAIFTSSLVVETARQDFIRIGPYFDDGTNIVSGTYRLYGLG